MINQVTLVGRLTKNPELSYTPSGVAVCKFALAVNRTFSNQQGEKETDFINCIAWRKQGENTANFLKKGNLAGVTGRISTRSYENQEGKKIYVVEVTAEQVAFLEPKNSNSRQSENNSSNGTYGSSNNQFDGEETDIQDDDLPF